ncbi:MAG: LCP family protein [Clostridium sp.]
MLILEKDTQMKTKKRKKKGMSRNKKILLGVLYFFLLLLAIGTGYLFSLFSKMDRVEINKDNLGIVDSNELSEYTGADKIRSIALFGVDSTDGGTGRSDSIMIATIDPVNKKIKLCSIMRDSYVTIPGRAGKDKLNHAYAFGGPELAIKTINQNFGLNIKDFVSVNFSSLPQIIDSLGGIQLNITSEELKYINGYIDDINVKDKTNSPHITKTGNQRVNGVQALAYSRIRYTAGGDYQRTERHRIVMSALFDKLLSMSPSTYPSVVNKLLPYVQTNLSVGAILDIGTDILSVGSKTLTQDRFPRDEVSNGITVNKIYYLNFNQDLTKQHIRDFIFK